MKPQFQATVKSDLLCYPRNGNYRVTWSLHVPKRGLFVHFQRYLFSNVTRCIGVQDP